ncbi:MAG: ribose-phosphate diphosphokinase [Candidatus Improbicoccus pseudotrichonymphae]|uniref:ribose-phosphate diphosphokinase n=1 Tax=Candidatus Improbicoccus pseudotrichonymphae TaxID=3033792 RepID=A0AA48HVJ4_9FIRM|nr:MAG: ribose-phosphate diphosphokinase [Candidatus Improbicoccus pseudotrichonymphae]
MSNIKIFSGNSNLQLANSLCLQLGVRLSKCDLGKFSDGEISLVINENVKNFECYIVQSTSNPVNDNLMEALILSNALRSNGASKITMILPYFGYSRQDKKTKIEPITSRLVANLIEKAGVNEIITVDIHALQILGYFNISSINIDSSNIFCKYIKEKLIFDEKEFVLVSPDCGAIKKTRNLFNLLGCQNNNIVIVDKYRKRANVSEVMNIVGDVKNKKVIMLDDIIDTAGTICNAANALIEKGASEVNVCASHAVLSGNAIERIKNSCIKKFVFLNTVFMPREKKLENFDIIDISGEFSKLIVV